MVDMFNFADWAHDVVDQLTNIIFYLWEIG